MKKEFLLALGVSDDIAKQIMDENGKDIEREKGKTTTALTDLAKANETLTSVQTQLKSFEGVDVEKLKTDIGTLRTELANKDTQHKEEIAKRDRAAETATFLASKKFVNDATREYYAAKINAALESDDSRGKSRADILTTLTTGDDGKPLPDIFQDADQAKPFVVNMPPSGPIDSEKLAKLGGQIAGLGQVQQNLNAHRIVK